MAQTQLRLGRVAVRVVLASTAGTLAVWAVASVVLDIPPEFPPLAGPVPTILFTVVFTMAAVGVYSAVTRRASDPVRTFRVVAGVALLVSFLPDLWLLTDGASVLYPGATVPGVATLMLQHVVAAVIVVWLVTAAARRAGA